MVGGSVKIDISEPMVNPSTSDQGESQSDDDVPYFSDIEAMVIVQRFVTWSTIIYTITYYTSFYCVSMIFSSDT